MHSFVCECMYQLYTFGEVLPVFKKSASTVSLYRVVTLAVHIYGIYIIMRYPGEMRVGVPGPSYMIGQGASADNTVQPGSVCQSVNNTEDTVKEGNRLSVLRLNSSETAVRIGGRQALFVETANDGEYFCAMTNQLCNSSINVHVSIHHGEMCAIEWPTVNVEICFISMVTLRYV